MPVRPSLFKMRWLPEMRTTTKPCLQKASIARGPETLGTLDIHHDPALTLRFDIH